MLICSWVKSCSATHSEGISIMSLIFILLRVLPRFLLIGMRYSSYAEVGNY